MYADGKEFCGSYVHRPIFLGIHHHKIEWIRKADRDSCPDGQPIIWGIQIERVKEE